MDYKVGQILYTILKDRQIVIPIQVIEQITVKDLESERTNYKVLLPNKKSQKINIERLENVFLDLDEVSEYILSRTKESVDKMVEDAINLEDTFFNSKVNKDIDIACINENNKVKINGNNKLKIHLENGQVANIIDNTSTLADSIALQIEEENESTTTWWIQFNIRYYMFALIYLNEKIFFFNFKFTSDNIIMFCLK